jgi:hypothetical protein
VRDDDGSILGAHIIGARRTTVQRCSPWALVRPDYESHLKGPSPTNRSCPTQKSPSDLGTSTLSVTDWIQDDIEDWGTAGIL